MKRVGAVLLVAVLAGAAAYAALREPNRARQGRVELVDACDVPRAFLQRVWRGYVPYRSGDILLIERHPNGFGKRHASAFPYAQNVPLLLYGPSFIRPGTYRAPATIADLAPTFAELLDFDDFPQRDGRVLEEALLPDAPLPKLIITVVWDGGGDNLLARWPKSWPNLKTFIPKTAEFTNAIIGSTPTITPAAHATIGTGSFPKAHGLPDGRMRARGTIIDPWEKSSPKYLRVKALADLYDAAIDNRPIVGMMARDSWHLGMIGHGSYLQEGDKDVAVMDTHGFGTDFRTNKRYYRLPNYLRTNTGLQEAITEIDERDGELDGSWLGNAYLSVDNAQVRFTPVWSIYQTDRLIEMIDKEGFGQDDVPDLLFTNYKNIDLASHEWTMDDPEQRDNLAETDAELPRLIAALDRLVGKGNYVMALTSDHGLTAPPERRGGWPIFVPELTRDINATFDHTTPNVPLVDGNRGWSLTFSRSELEANDVTAEDISRFARDYTLEDNLRPGDDMPAQFRGRGTEKVFLTALTPSELEEALACAP